MTMRKQIKSFIEGPQKQSKHKQQIYHYSSIISKKKLKKSLKIIKSVDQNKIIEYCIKKFQKQKKFIGASEGTLHQLLSLPVLAAKAKIQISRRHQMRVVL